MDYIKELKIAVINSDFKKMEELAEIAFESDDKEKLQEAATLIAEAIRQLEIEKAKTLEEMNNIKKIRAYAKADAYNTF